MFGFTDTVSVFYECLVTLMVAKSDDEEALLNRAKVIMSKLRSLAEDSLVPCLSKVCFLEAEMAAVRGDAPKATTSHELAMPLSKKHGICNKGTMACERAGMIYLTLNSSSSAYQCPCRAYQCRDNWGARAKVGQLASVRDAMITRVFNKDENQN